MRSVPSDPVRRRKPSSERPSVSEAPNRMSPLRIFTPCTMGSSAPDASRTNRCNSRAAVRSVLFPAATTMRAAGLPRRVSTVCPSASAQSPAKSNSRRVRNRRMGQNSKVSLRPRSSSSWPMRYWVRGLPPRLMRRIYSPSPCFSMVSVPCGVSISARSKTGAVSV